MHNLFVTNLSYRLLLSCLALIYDIRCKTISFTQLSKLITESPHLLITLSLGFLRESLLNVI